MRHRSIPMLLGKLLSCIVVGVLAAPVTGVAGPLRTGDAARNFSAVLLDLQGDVRRLDGARLPAAQRPVVEARVTAFLNILPLLAREYLAADGRLEAATVKRLRALKSAYRADDKADFRRRLHALLGEFPLDTRRLTQAPVSDAQIRWAKRTYRVQCMSCHGHHNPDSGMPAPNLFAWAHEMKPETFAARMIVGLRGTPAINLRNPLSKSQMAALIAYFRRN
ncbi:MAG: cytochrome c [Acidihalobacter sp.]